MKNIRRKRSFTLMEILLVVMIIGFLTAMAVPHLTGRGKQAKAAGAKAQIETELSAALGEYEFDIGEYPTTAQGLTALVEKPALSAHDERWNGPYLNKQKIPKDPWGRDYLYICPGGHNKEEYDLYSYGPDGVESDDDITNWE